MAGPGDLLTSGLGRAGPGGTLTYGSGRDLAGPDSEIEATDGRAGGDVGAAGN